MASNPAFGYHVGDGPPPELKAPPPFRGFRGVYAESEETDPDFVRVQTFADKAACEAWYKERVCCTNPKYPFFDQVRPIVGQTLARGPSSPSPPGVPALAACVSTDVLGTPPKLAFLARRASASTLSWQRQAAERHAALSSRTAATPLRGLALQES